MAVISNAGIAADWKRVSSNHSALIDASSIRRDTFPKPVGGIIYPGQTETYKIGWMRFEEGQEVVLLEVVFDCRGSFGVMQQVVNGENAQSRYKSYDNTQNFRRVGPALRSFAPDSAYEAAQKLVCK